MKVRKLEMVQRKGFGEERGGNESNLKMKVERRGSRGTKIQAGYKTMEIVEQGLTEGVNKMNCRHFVM